jgi:hypothetical protein
LGFLKLQGLQHYLRLRKGLRVTDQLSAELGVDLNVKRQTYIPHAALSYEVGPLQDASANQHLQSSGQAQQGLCPACQFLGSHVEKCF